MASRAHLWRAWERFRRGKGGRPSVRAFAPEAAREVARLHDELSVGTYQPRPFRTLFLHEPKRRLIAAATVRDRVVHHAVVASLGPHLDPGLVDPTYACIPGRGVHRAVLAMIAAMRRRRFVVLLDVRRYFISIDRGILIDEVMARRIKDRRALALLRTIAEAGGGLYETPAVRSFLELPEGVPGPGVGLPIGNLTSQWWGNHYLAGLDHFVMRTLRPGEYQRYMDDIVLLGDDAAKLADDRDAVAEWLWERRRLTLRRAGPPVPTSRPVTYLGQRLTRAGSTPTRAALRRMQARLAGLVSSGSPEGIERSIAAYRGVLRFGTRGVGGE